MQSRTLNLRISPGPAFAIGAIVLGASLVARVLSYSTVTSDYTYFIAKWFVALHTNPGLSAFVYPFSDYAPLYLYLLKILTFLPVYSLWSAKTLSLAFDVGLGYLTYRMLKSTTDYSQAVLFMCAVIVFSIPTVVINSSLWGQSDALYALGVLGALYAMMREKPRYVALWFALALAFKLQAIFFLPVILGYFAARREYWLELLWIPVVYVACVVPAWLGGGNFFSLLSTYAHQGREYTSLNVSSQSIFAFTDNLHISQRVQNVLFWAGLLASALVAATVAYVVAHLPRRPSVLLFWSVLCCVAVPYFLPRMHERYFYLADVLSVIYALYSPRRWFIPVLVVTASLLAYMPFLSSQVPYFANIHVNLRVPSLMLAFTILSLLVLLYYSARKRVALPYTHANETHGEGRGRGRYDALSVRQARRLYLHRRPVDRPHPH
jgi:Gpi18-like mannosyltransferase